VTNPRGRNDTSYGNDAARLPAIPTVRSADSNMNRFVDAVREWLETRSGSRGDRFEKAVTLRDLVELGRFEPSAVSTGSLNGNGLRATVDTTVTVTTPNGVTRLTIDEFTRSILRTRLFRDLMLKLSDPKRFDDLPETVKQVLLRDIAQEAAQRGADVRRIETKIQDANQSLAMRVEEVTASLGSSLAGVRQTAFTWANASKATAGVVTQIRAAVGDPGSFTGAGITLEETMFGVASTTEGLYGQQTIKIDADGYVAPGQRLSARQPAPPSSCARTSSPWWLRATRPSPIRPTRTRAACRSASTRSTTPSTSTATCASTRSGRRWPA
jgi:hypothetical protein